MRALRKGAGLTMFAITVLYAADAAVRRWQWAADIAHAMGPIPEDDMWVGR